jgi:kumamolisin
MDPGAAPNAGNGPSGAYDLDSVQNGGTPVALYELSSAAYSDAAVYASKFGLNSPTLIQKAVDGGAGDIAPLEVMLDISMVMAVSNPTSIYIYTGNDSGTAPLDTYTQIADDNLVGQVSSSWYTGCEGDVGASTMDAESAVFKQMAAQGIAVFIAAGDNGAYNAGSVNCVSGSEPQVLDPGSQPYVTSAGGTTLTTSSNQAYVSETVWNELSIGDGATGGGVSAYWSIPSYQIGMEPDDTQFSTTMRNLPDMSLNADPETGYYIYCSTCSDPSGWQTVGGTSAVAPQLAAFWSLVSEGLRERAGFANPALYAVAGVGSRYSADFHAVSTGNNAYYDAFGGYNNATGWGSYDGASLYAALLSIRRAAELAPILGLLLQ